VTAALPKSIRLRTLNALLASMVGTAPQLRSDVDAVLRVFEADDETDPRLNATDLAAAAEAIFQGPDRAEALPAIALEGQHRVDEVLDDLGPSETSLFGDVAHEHERQAALLRHVDEP
jgi:hypothetical protein